MVSGHGGMKVIEVEEKILQLGLTCQSWDAFLEELHLLGEL